MSPALTSRDVPDDLITNSEPLPYPAVRIGADEGFNFDHLLLCKLGITARIAAHLGAMLYPILRVLFGSHPSKMLGIDAAIKAFPARVPHLMSLAWRRAMHLLAYNPMCHLRAASHRNKTVSLGISGVGPRQAFIAVVRDGNFGEVFEGFPVRRSSSIRASMVQKPLIVHSTESSFSVSSLPSAVGYVAYSHSFGC